MTSTNVPILDSVKGLERLKQKLEKIHKSEIELIDVEIQRLQSFCTHMNSYRTGWEGGRYTVCPDCGLED